MPSYKDNNGSWYCKFYFQDHEGNKIQKLKRGFERKKDSQEYERDFLQSRQFQPNILFKNFLEIYKTNVFPQIREHSIHKKEYIYKRILPYFKDKEISSITPIDIKKWQNELIKDNLSSTYIAGIQKELSAIFNHAVKYYGLKENPIHKVGKVNIPGEKPSIMRFWTYEEYKKVIALINDIKAKTAINLLYWTGIRKGELFALTWNDFNFYDKTLNIDKSYQRLKGKDVITPTKTYENRVLLLPDTTINQLQEYKTRCYNSNFDDPIFPWSKKFIEDGIKQGAKDSGVNKIHIHGLRHSHASYLISKGANIVLVSKRLGHKDTAMTLNTYSHFFPNDEISLIKIMNNEK